VTHGIWFILNAVEPTRDEVRHQLDRILASEVFKNSDRLSRFLRYVVERTLAGEGDRLKEYVVGTEVFERGEQYDPRVDSIVRVEAGRLRTKLEEYYSGPRSHDPVVIRIPRGGYTPAFERRELPATKPRRKLLPVAAAAAAELLAGVVVWGTLFWAAAARPTSAVTIAVLPFASYSTDKGVPMLAARITDGVTSELARLGTLGVTSHTSARQFGARQSLREVARSLNADVVMEGSIDTEGDLVRVTIRLVDASRDRKFWVEEFTGTIRNVPELQRRIAAAAGAAAARRDQ
jgi:TolB-like protein/ketosteroid isomerase-like protein